MYTFYSDKGEKVVTKSIKEFAQRYSMNYSYARTLACGARNKMFGWCSGHPRAKKARARFLLKLINIYTGETDIIGMSVSSFAKRHNLCHDEVHALLSKRKLCYRGWMLNSTYNKAYSVVADKNF